MTLTDTGPLVALLDKDDAHHADCVAALYILRDDALLQDNSLRLPGRRLSLFSTLGKALRPRVPLLSYSNAYRASSDGAAIRLSEDFISKFTLSDPIRPLLWPLPRGMERGSAE